MPFYLPLKCRCLLMCWSPNINGRNTVVHRPLMTKCHVALVWEHWFSFITNPFFFFKCNCNKVNWARLDIRLQLGCPKRCVEKHTYFVDCRLAEVCGSTLVVFVSWSFHGFCQRLSSHFSHQLWHSEPLIKEILFISSFKGHHGCQKHVNSRFLRTIESYKAQR